MARMLGYLLLVVLGAAFAVLYTQYNIYLFVGILILYPVLIFILACISGLLLEVTIMEPGKTVEQGETFKLSIRVRNKSFFPVLFGQLGYKFGYGIMNRREKGKLKFHIKARGETVLELTGSCEYCGIFRFSLYKVWIRDYLRIFSFGKRLHETGTINIAPVLDIVRLQVENATTFYNDEYEEFYEDHPGNDPSEVFEVREYHEGDKLQRIHWKLSSKKDILMVKEFSDPIVISSVVICDNECRGTGREFVKQWSELIQKTIQVSYSLLIQQVNHYVYWFDSKAGSGVREEIRSEEDFNVLMERILQTEPYVESDDYISYLVYAERIAKYSNIFYVGQNHYERLEQQGVHVKVVE